MSAPRPKLMRGYEQVSPSSPWPVSTAGFWVTTDGRYWLHRSLDKRWWYIEATMDPAGEAILSQHTLIGQAFPTRREALDALALALHIEEGS